MKNFFPLPCTAVCPPRILSLKMREAMKAGFGVHLKINLLLLEYIENQATGIGEKISSLLFLIGVCSTLGIFWLVPLIGGFEV